MFMEIIRNQQKNGESEKAIELKNAGNLDWVKYSNRFKDLNIHKNQLTIRLATQEWIDNYRRQEAERYKHPTQPWCFVLEDQS